METSFTVNDKTCATSVRQFDRGTIWQELVTTGFTDLVNVLYFANVNNLKLPSDD